MIKCDMGKLEIKGNQMIVQSEVSLVIIKLLENADSEFGKELIFESCLGSFLLKSLMTDKKLDEKKTVKYSQFVHDMFKKVQQFNKELNEEDVKEDDGDFRQVGTFTICN